MLRERRISLLVVCLLAILAAVHLSRLNKGHNWGDDFSAYIMQAEGIATDTTAEAYAKLSFQFSHSTLRVGPVVYPWGFPLLLAPVYSLFGLNVIAFKCLVLAFLLGSLAVTFHLYRLGLTTLQSALVVSILGLSPALLAAGTQILSDPPFLFFCMSAMLLIQRGVLRRQPIGAPWLNSVLLGTAIFMAYFTRSIGFVLLPTLFAAQLHSAIADRHERLAKQGSFGPKFWFDHALPYVLFFLGVIFSRVALPTGPLELAYISLDPSHLIASVFRGIPYYFEAGQGFFQGAPTAISLVAAILAVIGACVRFRQDWIYLVFSALYIGVLLIWPYYQGIVRFILPLLPFYIYFAFKGASSLSSLTTFHTPGSRSFQLPLDYGLALAAIMYFVYLLPPFRWSDFAQDPRGGPFGPEAQGAYRYIRLNLPRDAVVQSRKPRVLMLLTDRRGVVYAKTKDLDQGVATHYLVHLAKGKPLRSVDRTVVENPQRFPEIYSNSAFRLYQIGRNYAQ